MENISSLMLYEKKEKQLKVSEYLKGGKYFLKVPVKMLYFNLFFFTNGYVANGENKFIVVYQEHHFSNSEYYFRHSIWQLPNLLSVI